MSSFPSNYCKEWSQYVDCRVCQSVYLRWPHTRTHTLMPLSFYSAPRTGSRIVFSEIALTGTGAICGRCSSLVRLGMKFYSPAWMVTLVDGGSFMWRGAHIKARISAWPMGPQFHSHVLLSESLPPFQLFFLIFYLVFLIKILLF